MPIILLAISGLAIFVPLCQATTYADVPETAAYLCRSGKCEFAYAVAFDSVARPIFLREDGSPFQRKLGELATRQQPPLSDGVYEFSPGEESLTQCQEASLSESCVMSLRRVSSSEKLRKAQWQARIWVAGKNPWIFVVLAAIVLAVLGAAFAARKRRPHAKL